MSQILKRATFKAVNSHQLSIVIVPVIMVLLATLTVVLRFQARRLQRSQILFDDWLCLFALILTWVFQAVNMAAVFAGGAGLPIETVLAIDPNALSKYLKIILVNFSLWVVTVSVVQLSIVFFYVRLFGVKSVFRWICYTYIFMISAFGIAGLFSEIFSCTPVSKSWNPLEDGHCLPEKPYCSSIGIIHVIFDLGIVLMPMPIIWKLKLAIRSKIVLSVLLCLGLIATIISLLKIVCIFNLTGIPQEDITDYLWLTILFQTLELPIGIICCCVPSLKPVMVEYASQYGSITQRLRSYIVTTNSGTSSKRSIGSQHPGNPELDSTAGFTRIDSASQGLRGDMLKSNLGNNASAKVDSIELMEGEGQGQGDGQAIRVVTGYSIGRQ